MTMNEDAVTQAVADARALLSTLLSSEWQELHVTSGDTEIFVARHGANANPMRMLQAPDASDVPAIEVVGPEVQIKAPHVATVVFSLPVGASVNAGQKVATLSVLDEEQDVLSPVAGAISKIDAACGTLVEYDEPLLSLVQVV